MEELYTRGWCHNILSKTGERSGAVQSRCKRDAVVSQVGFSRATMEEEALLARMPQRHAHGTRGRGEMARVKLTATARLSSWRPFPGKKSARSRELLFLFLLLTGDRFPGAAAASVSCQLHPLVPGPSWAHRLQRGSSHQLHERPQGVLENTTPLYATVVLGDDSHTPTKKPFRTAGAVSP